MYAVTSTITGILMHFSIFMTLSHPRSMIELANVTKQQCESR
jgi:hypothetical protein